MSAILLPETLDQFCEAFQNPDVLEILKKCQDLSKLPFEEHTQWKYAGSGLMSGRPLNSAIVFMGGSSGSGKSSTVNFLFEDDNLCATSTTKSETKEPLIVQKGLRVPLENFSKLHGFLRFIDVPGCFDTDGRHEAKNLAMIQSFKKNIPSLQTRNLSHIKNLPKDKVREQVFPNVVLFTVKATDNHQGAGLEKSLEMLNDFSDIVDKVRPNVLICLTHSMSLATNETRFTAKLADATATIRNVVKAVLGIDNVPVIPVENQPYDYDLPRDGDFYVLPNGQLSHHNLFDAMMKLFDDNNDILARLFVGHYFGTSTICPEKQENAVTIKADKLQLSVSDVTVASKALANLNLACDELSEVETFRFQRLGYGFCPVSETIKYSSLISSGDKVGLEQKLVNIFGVTFLVPKCVQARINKKSRFHCISFFAKEEYQSHMKASYGIEVDLKLVVTANSEGRWIIKDNSEMSSSVVSLVQEFQFATFTIENPAEHIECYGFKKELYDLPEQYTDETAHKFRAFFSKWGTHIVQEQSVGGIIQLDCTVQKKQMTKENLQEISGNASSVFEKLLQAGKVDIRHEVNAGVETLRKVGVNNEQLQMEGGSPPSLITLKTIKSEEIQDWAKSVPEHPVELRYTMKLFPFYNLIQNGQKYESLRQATKDYLAGTLEERIKDVYGVTREGVSKDAVDNAKLKEAGASCFPIGTMITLSNGKQSPIESLCGQSPSLETVSFERNFLIGEKYQRKVKSTKFCVFLDQKPNTYVEYLEMEFSNNKTLIVSPSHLIFEYIDDNSQLKCKQAQDFCLGDKTVFHYSSSWEIPRLQKISQRICKGAYCPLTTTGTFLANGFLVSSYADVKSFQLADRVMLPLKIWCFANNHIDQKAKNKSEDTTSQTNKAIVGIHPYAKFLMKLKLTQK